MPTHRSNACVRQVQGVSSGGAATVAAQVAQGACRLPAHAAPSAPVTRARLLSAEDRGDAECSDTHHDNDGGDAVDDRAGPAHREPAHELTIAAQADHRDHQRHQ